MTGSTVRLGPHSKQAFRSNLLTPYPDAQFLLGDKHSIGKPFSQFPPISKALLFTSISTKKLHIILV